MRSCKVFKFALKKISTCTLIFICTAKAFCFTDAEIYFGYKNILHGKWSSIRWELNQKFPINNAARNSPQRPRVDQFDFTFSLCLPKQNTEKAKGYVIVLYVFFAHIMFIEYFVGSTLHTNIKHTIIYLLIDAKIIIQSYINVSYSNCDTQLKWSTILTRVK